MPSTRRPGLKLEIVSAGHETPRTHGQPQKSALPAPESYHSDDTAARLLFKSEALKLYWQKCGVQFEYKVRKVPSCDGLPPVSVQLVYSREDSSADTKEDSSAGTPKGPCFDSGADPWIDEGAADHSPGLSIDSSEYGSIIYSLPWGVVARLKKRALAEVLKGNAQMSVEATVCAPDPDDDIVQPSS
jgi:hypothetical protein